MDCVFCKIIKGEIPSAKVFENENIFVFLDINPLTEGHCLIIPKKHFTDIFDIDGKVLEEINAVAKSLAGKMKNNLGATGVNLVNASGKDAEQSVFHFHLHLIPRHENDNLEMSKWWQSKVKKPSAGNLKKIAEKLE